MKSLLLFALLASAIAQADAPSPRVLNCRGIGKLGEGSTKSVLLVRDPLTSGYEYLELLTSGPRRESSTVILHAKNLRCTFGGEAPMLTADCRTTLGSDVLTDIDAGPGVELESIRTKVEEGGRYTATRRYVGGFEAADAPSRETVCLVQ